MLAWMATTMSPQGSPSVFGHRLQSQRVGYGMQVPASLEEQWRDLVAHLDAHPQDRPRNMPLE